MNYSQNCIGLIKQFEGCRLTPYKDAAGFLTVGYGHRTNSPNPITQVQAEYLLQSDTAKAAVIVNEYCHGELPADLNQNQFDALASMAFNLGRAPFMNTDGTKTHLYQCLLAGDEPGAAGHILDFDHAGGNMLPGLFRRRQAEQHLFTERIHSIPVAA